MTDDFKRKLQDYRNGTLTDEERAELEQQLEQMEIYQSYLDEMLDGEEDHRNAKSIRVTEKEIKLHKREASLLRKGKWRARIGTALTLISLYIIITLLTSIGTVFFFSAGDPDRSSIYSDVVESAIMVTNPNVTVHLSSDTGAYFNKKVTSKMTKRVGDQYLEVGDFSGTFLFNWMRLYNFTWSDSEAARSGVFQFPGTKELSNDQEWKRLEMLPEGTVAEVYVSYNQLYKTDEFLQQFRDKQLEPLWFAVDNGVHGSGQDNDDGVIINPIGFTSLPLWHSDDGKVTKQETSGSSVTKYPAIEQYGSGQLRDENFIKTLRLLEEHKSIAKRVVYGVNITKSLAYVETNGVNIYGAVVTGPTKEFLKLKDDPAVSSIRVGKVTLWNWNDES